MRNLKTLPVSAQPTALPPGTGISGVVPADRIQLYDGGAALTSLHPLVTGDVNNAPELGTLPGNFATVVRAGRP